jgi:acyl carrier protein
MEVTATVELKKEIKLLILETLNIKNIQPDEIDESVLLFSKDNILNLDSIDGIELIMAIQKKYDVRIGDQNLARNVLESIDSIADFVITRTQNNKGV